MIQFITGLNYFRDNIKFVIEKFLNKRNIKIMTIIQSSKCLHNTLKYYEITLIIKSRKFFK